MVFVSCQFYLALFTVNSGSLSIFRSTCLFLNFSENLGIFRVALLFICQRSLGYMKVEDLAAMAEGLPLCKACFDNRYPTEI